MCETMNSQEDRINQSYCFKWSDYQDQLSGVLRQLLDEECMVDVTLVTAGERIQAHRIVLCACSTLFQELLTDVKEDHPTIILDDISATDIKRIIEYSYYGVVRMPLEEIRSLLDTAQLLKIKGLMNIESLEEIGTSVITKDNSMEDVIDSTSKLNESEDSTLDVVKENYEESQGDFKHSIEDIESQNRRKRRKRDSSKREYNEEMLEAAINDLKAGHTLVEAATKNNIPRSTLYMRAKSLGIQLNAARNEYPVECMKAAIETVIAGSSLQQASEMYSIPKTVLWRRIQKEGYSISRSEMRRTYDSDKREAAVKALERGENLTKVAQEFQIPKTTLFRDKARLIDEGKLPVSFLKKRKTENDELKKSRLEEAVNACRNGKMSQATASLTFDVPKTTIWRRLQQDAKKSDSSGKENGERKKNDSMSDDVKPYHDNQNFEYCEVSSEIPITYIDENAIAGDSVIILTTGEVEGFNLESNRQTAIIVNQDTGQDCITCDMNLENTDFTTKS